jgi:flagellar biosynthesis protein FlhF
VYLVLSVGTKYRDLKEIANVYSEITDYSIIFTKLDETSSVGVMLNMKMDTKCPLSYVTNGQGVPDDISRIDAQSVAKQLMS